MRLRWKILVVVLAGLLIVSLILNVFIFNLALDYYRDGSAVRLNPLSLGTYSDQPTDPNRLTVIFFGDSRAQNWPTPHELLFQIEHINRGIGNQTSTQIALRFDAHVRSLSPDVIVLQMCVNDLKTIPLFPDRRDNIVATCQANIEQIIASVHEQGATIILTTIFPVGEVPLQRRLVWSSDVAQSVRDVNQFIQSLAADNVIVFDAYGMLVDERGLLRDDLSLDELHLNGEGYAILNASLTPILLDLME